MAKRVYFAFYYNDVKSFRANIVRNHWLTKDDREDAGFFDASIWEASKKRGPLAVKRLINRALENTTVTAVLIGSGTYARRWVRYEIMKSLKRGNKLLGVHINGLKGKAGKKKLLGPNPFRYLGYKYRADGNMLLLRQYKNGSWIKYADVASYSINQAARSLRGKFFLLSKHIPVYDWVSDDGYNNFSDWIE